MEMDHFAHEHPLVLMERQNKARRKYGRDVTCRGCEKSCTFPLYACTECSFFLHKSCAGLPRSIRNPFHPHPLTLAFDVDISFTCQACLKGCKGFHFFCLVCDIQLDVDCALLKPDVEEGSRQLQHFTHLHPLTLVEKKHTEVTSGFKCLVCGDHCLGPCYGCDHCGIFLHQNCAELKCAGEVQHFSHQCPLVLHTRVHSFLCGACETWMQGICYHCELCNFYLDVACFESKDPTQIKHFSHSHTLSLKDKGDCLACEKKSSEPTYICSESCQSKFEIHKSCAKLTPWVESLLHPQHLLTLFCRLDRKLRARECRACCGKLRGLVYECGACGFELHDQCTKQVPIIQYKGHRHLLLYCEDIGHEVTCNACKTTCRPPLLHCPQCDFNLHLYCFPLPHTIKHKCHIHFLTLGESPNEDELSDEFCCDKFYCNICEKERDPRLPIYSCIDCSFVGEISCVMSEVSPLLKGEKGDVDLTTPEGIIGGKVICEVLEIKKSCKAEAGKVTTVWSGPKIERKEFKYDLPILNHIMSLFSELCMRESFLIGGRSGHFSDDEKKELESIFGTKEMKKGSNGAEASVDEEGRPDSSLYWKKKYGDFLGGLYGDFLGELDYSQPKDFMEFWEKGEEFVDYRDYPTPKSLEPNRWDNQWYMPESLVTVGSLRPRVERFLEVILYRTLDNMCKTRILDISKDQLVNWWKYLKGLQSAGFKIQFAFDHLNRVVNACFGLWFLEMVNKNVSDIDEEISKKSQELEDLKKNLKVSDIEEKISKKRQERENLKEKLKDLKQCRRDAYKLKWMKGKACAKYVRLENL